MTALALATRLTRNWRRSIKPTRPTGPAILDLVHNLYGRTAASEVVNQNTALNFSAVYAAVNLISDSMKTLPFSVYQRTSEKGKKALPRHPAYKVLHSEPNPETKPGQFKKFLQASVLLWGNGYAEIERTGRHEPFALWQIHPSRVTLDRNVRNVLVYRVIDDNGMAVEVAPDKMFHLIGFSTDGILGSSVIGFARESIGFALAAERHGAQFYGHNAQPGIALVHPGQLDEETHRRMRNSWRAQYGPGGDRHGVAVLEEGLDIKTFGMPHADAQFLESRVFQVDEIARWFKVPPHKLAEMSKATFSNIEHQAIEYVIDTILPWAIEWEEEANRKLLLPSERPRRFVKLQVNALMRGDAKARSEFYKAMMMMGPFSINDVLALEDMNPIGPAGEVHYVQTTLTNAETMIAEEEEKEEIEQPELPGEIPQAEVEEAATELVEQAIARLRRKEIKTIRTALKRRFEKHGKAAFAEWLESFYDEHGGELLETLQKPFRLMSVLKGLSDTETATALGKECDRIVTRGRGQLLAVIRDAACGTEAASILMRLDEWEHDNADSDTA